MRKGLGVRIVVWMLLTTALLGLKSNAAQDKGDRRLEIAAKRFEFVPSEITVKRGETVTLAMHSEDVAHGIKFKELDVEADIPKGKTVEVAVTPNQVGTFIGRCSHFCGSGHGRMNLTLHVTD